MIDGYFVAYLVGVLALVIAIVMVLTARKGFNGFAPGFILIAVLLIIRRIEDATHLIGEPWIAIESNLLIIVFCYQVWRVWKDRHDHKDYLHWRERWARERAEWKRQLTEWELWRDFHSEELHLLKEWREKLARLRERANQLETLRTPSENAATWNTQGDIAQTTRSTQKT